MLFHSSDKAYNLHTGKKNIPIDVIIIIIKAISNFFHLILLLLLQKTYNYQHYNY